MESDESCEIFAKAVCQELVIHEKEAALAGIQPVCPLTQLQPPKDELTAAKSAQTSP